MPRLPPFSVVIETIVHSTRIPIRSWLCGALEMCFFKNAVAAREIERRHPVTAKSASLMTQRIVEGVPANHTGVFSQL